jgi:hypothetical protein
MQGQGQGHDTGNGKSKTPKRMGRPPVLSDAQVELCEIARAEPGASLGALASQLHSRGWQGLCRGRCGSICTY